jgi:peptidoglycan/xylan/chitin deacetylase (PgdA/CDA1 family)
MARARPRLPRRTALGAALGALASARRVSAAAAASAPAVEVTILLYHDATATQVAQDLLGRIRAGAQPISLETLVGALDGRIALPPGLPVFHVTCDDGLASQYRAGIDAVEQVRRSAGWFVPLTYFVMTGGADGVERMADLPGDAPLYADGVHRYLTRDQAVDLVRRGHHVASHTLHHARLPALSVGARNAEVEVGEQRVEALWQLAGRERPVRAFAYPFGQSSGQTVYVQRLGYDLAFGTSAVTVHPPAMRYTLGRLRRT